MYLSVAFSLLSTICVGVKGSNAITDAYKARPTVKQQNGIFSIQNLVREQKSIDVPSYLEPNFERPPTIPELHSTEGKWINFFKFDSKKFLEDSSVQLQKVFRDIEKSTEDSNTKIL